MLDYLQIYPDFRDLVKRHTPENRCALYEAAFALAFDGSEPDWPEDDVKWYSWDGIRAYIKAREKALEDKRRAGRRSAEQRSAETGSGQQEPTDGNRGQQTATEANRNQQTPTERSRRQQTAHVKAQDQTQDQEQTQDVDTHDEIQQQGDAGARATVPAGQYDAEHPDRPFDLAWQTGDKARRAIAQRILNAVVPKINKATVTVEGDTDRDSIVGREIFDALCAAMIGGIPPDACQQLGLMQGSLWRWEARLKQLALDAGSAPEDRIPVWRSQMDQLQEDLAEPVTFQSAYG